MRSVVARVLLVVGVALVSAAAAPPFSAERTEIPEKYKWDLSGLYPTIDAWTAAKQRAIARIPEIEKFRGHVGDSAATLRDTLATMMGLDREIGQVRFYASRLSDEDLRDAKHLEMLQSAEQAVVRLRASSSFVRPEILAMDPAKVRAYVAQEPGLRDYAVWLEDLLRWKPHTLSASEEKIAARALDLGTAGESIRSVFTNADLPYPEVTLSSGEKVRLDAAGYTRYRAAADRRDRERVFESFWTEYGEFQRTLGAALYSQVKAHVVNRDIRGFKSSLEAALFPYAIPEDVYRRLIADVNASLPTLHRYLELRRRMLGIDRLGYEDLYAPIVKGVEESYTPEQAMDLLLRATSPLGKAYTDVLREGYSSRWVDMLPSPGKRSGAYSETAYGVHPYQLLNFVGLYEDVSTLAHEFGHSMHSYLADRKQPYATHDYSTFVAEVASTFNENLLFHQMMKDAKDDATRLALLGSHLELLRTTIFRQTMFAEFELEIHERAERGETLTGENLSALYLSLARKYYGHDKGVCEVKDLYGVEWAYIPHFYYNFYVYQYATSLVASISLSDAVLDEAAGPGVAKPRRDAYLAMLSAGSSKYPIELLREAGVDMTTSEPFAAAMRDMNRTMDEIEAIRKKKGR